MKDISIFFLFTLLCFSAIEIRATPNYYGQECTNTTVFTPESTYRSNLNKLFSSLSSKATNSLTGFTNDFVGIRSPDVAYGAFLCRGDVSTDVCSDCVLTATREALQRCSNSKVAIMWYDECMLRYSNQSFIGNMDYHGGLYMTNAKTATDEPNRFLVDLTGTLNDIANWAAAGDRYGKKFAVGQINSSDFQTIYALAQCTPDLASSDCHKCIRWCIAYFAGCCFDKIGARFFVPSCNVRFELYQFYNATIVAPLHRPPPPPLPPPIPVPPPLPLDRGISPHLLVTIIVPIGVCVLIFNVVLCFCFLTSEKPIIKRYVSVQAGNDGGNDTTADHSLQYDLATIQAATNNFSSDNKIGQGGFGSVYKGVLDDGQEIAVKRLSQKSKTGAAEFKNEVLVVAKLRHRNLARLLGFCLEANEKILLYEFVQNKSLDEFIFDPTKRAQMEWGIRQNIIEGVARGVLYLHEESNLRIIHRDLKASNILLDAKMNPKIADFGTARLFMLDETQANTTIIAGTFGYMAPEYIKHGHNSVKLDVFSYRVLILEIVSGQKNNCLRHGESLEEGLLSYAWKNWREGTPLNVIDPLLRSGSHLESMILRCIHIGLLCVQENASYRPTMATVLLMLSSYSVTLPVPSKPAFFMHRGIGVDKPLEESSFETTRSTPSNYEVQSKAEVSITELLPR